MSDIVFAATGACALAALVWSLVTIEHAGSRRWLRILCLGLLFAGVGGVATALFSHAPDIAADSVKGGVLEAGGQFAYAVFGEIALMTGVMVCVAGMIVDIALRYRQSSVS